jgi:hypothetical protein
MEVGGLMLFDCIGRSSYMLPEVMWISVFRLLTFCRAFLLLWLGLHGGLGVIKTV